MPITKPLTASTANSRRIAARNASNLGSSMTRTGPGKSTMPTGTKPLSLRQEVQQLKQEVDHLKGQLSASKKSENEWQEKVIRAEQLYEEKLQRALTGERQEREQLQVQLSQANLMIASYRRKLEECGVNPFTLEDLPNLEALKKKQMNDIEERIERLTQAAKARKERLSAAIATLQDKYDSEQSTVQTPSSRRVSYSMKGNSTPVTTELQTKSSPEDVSVQNLHNYTKTFLQNMSERIKEIKSSADTSPEKPMEGKDIDFHPFNGNENTDEDDSEAFPVDEHGEVLNPSPACIHDVDFDEEVKDIDQRELNFADANMSTDSVNKSMSSTRSDAEENEDDFNAYDVGLHEQEFEGSQALDWAPASDVIEATLVDTGDFD